MSAAGSAAAISLVFGGEQALAQRAVSEYLSQLRTYAPDATEIHASAANYEKGELGHLLAPSLFTDSQIVLISNLESATDAFIDDFARYVEAPEPNAWIVLQHGGGNRGLKVLKALRAKGFPETKAELRKGAAGERQKEDLVVAEVESLGVSIDRAAAQALVAAVGSNTLELLAFARQLAADTEDHISVQRVTQFFRGRVETKPFEVSNALAKGKGTDAILLARQAMQTGVNPLVLVAVLAQTFRAMAKVRIPGLSSKDLGMPPWQAERARGDGRLWTDASLGFALRRLADADSDIKGGGSRDQAGTVELAIIDIYRQLFRQ